MKALDQYTWDHRSLIKNGKRWYPVMGEFHYARCPEDHWKDTLLKMKSCGVDVVSTYVIWLFHEEIEGQYTFEGRRNLRAFVELASECGLKVWLRPGPWAHAEARHGGFPDWLLQKVPEARTNSEAYFAEVEKYYRKVYEQVEGLMYEDGGPIIGVQIENEYGHCGGLSGEEGQAHMLRLHKMAVDIGLRAPYMSATGWGGAIIADLLPVMGAYSDAPWDSSLEKLEPNPNYLFSEERDDKKIGCDHEIGCGLTFDASKYPYLTAELGGGNQVTAHRRPIITAKDTAAMTLCKMGSGANLLGYYMYAGGVNPHGFLSTLQESKSVGDINDLPEYSYDFNAPLKAYGQVSDTALELKCISMFIHDFGQELCEMEPVFPEDTVIYATDLSSLRQTIRSNGTSGYVFLNNYERGYSMAEHRDVRLAAKLSSGETIEFDPQTINDGDFFFYPFCMKLDESSLLKSVNATPLCKLLNNGKTYYCFYGKEKPVFHVEGDTSSVLHFLTKEDALRSYKFTINGEDYLLRSDAVLTCEDGRVYASKCVQPGEQLCIEAYPSLPSFDREVMVCVDTAVISEDASPKFEASEKPSAVMLQRKASVSEAFTASAVPCGNGEYDITLHYGSEPVHEVFLELDYTAEGLEVFVNGVKEDDDFYTGQKYYMALKRFGYPASLHVKLNPLQKDAPLYLERWPEPVSGKDTWCELNAATLLPEVKIPITIQE